MKITGIILAVGMAFLVCGTVLAKGSKPRPASGAAEPAIKGWQLTAYYLHGNYRCPTCIAIEKQSREVVEGDFKKEIAEGRVVYRSLDTEAAGNEHFVVDYELVTKSLVLSLRKDGKEVKWKNLPEIWSTVHTPEKFREYVAGEVRAMLAGMN